MEKLDSRYSGPITSLHSYENEFIVVCPKCSQAAHVARGTEATLGWAQLICRHCTHVETEANLVRYKVSIRRHCDNCGKLISKVIPHSREKVDGMAICCPTCGETRIYRCRNDQYCSGYGETSHSADPYFRLPLWLQGSIKNDLFWAYNRIHLHDIKVYVAAILRERQSMLGTTMVEKLPRFITEAKNREAVLHLIERLERK